MIDYETFCKIRDYQGQQGLKAEQIARNWGWMGAPYHAGSMSLATVPDNPRNVPASSIPTRD